ncbi:MAG: hypothetical protein V4723_21550 [Pseudomonadota bacterium]
MPLPTRNPRYVDDNIRNQLGIHPAYTVHWTSARRETRQGCDNEISCYDVQDNEGATVARFELHDSVSTRSPYAKTVYYYRIPLPQSPNA